MADDESVFYNAVAVALQGDYHRIKRMRKEAENWECAFRNLNHQQLFDIKIPNPLEEYAALKRLGITLLLREDPAYPSMLREIPSAPFGIYVRSSLPSSEIFNDHIRMAIVGTRRATPEGKHTAHLFARELRRAGCVIISGLAFGIDAAAHEGALEDTAQTGTLAVLAGGLDSIFPPANEKLAKQILAYGGALISEYPPGEPAYPWRFLERNRIVSGISQGVLVVEAPARSGAIATARFALEQNRDLFVVPGSITHSHFKGSHALIRQGAELVTAPEEIIEAYGLERNTSLIKDGAGLSPQETLILKALRSAGRPLGVDKIIEAAKLEPRIVNRSLSVLLIKHVIKEMEEGYTI